MTKYFTYKFYYIKYIFVVFTKQSSLLLHFIKKVDAINPKLHDLVFIVSLFILSYNFFQYVFANPYNFA